MENLLDIKNLCILDEAKNIEECIVVATNLLEENGYTNSNYKGAVLKNFKKYGQNFIISPYIILPHARPEQGVIKTGVSIVLLNNPLICTKSNVSIRLVIVLAAKNSFDHLELLKFFSNILSDNERLHNIFEVSEKEELMKWLLKRGK